MHLTITTGSPFSTFPHFSLSLSHSFSHTLSLFLFSSLTLSHFLSLSLSLYTSDCFSLEKIPARKLRYGPISRFPIIRQGKLSMQEVQISTRSLISLSKLLLKLPQQLPHDTPSNFLSHHTTTQITHPTPDHIP